MLRRDFLTSGFALFLFKGPAIAEPSRSWRVAYVSSGRAGMFVEAFRRALNSLGYEEGKNITIDIREAKGNFSLLPDLVREVVDLKPDVIVAEATPAIAAAQKATSAIPIVMSPATDPVGSGFIKSFAHPGGNITGIANMYGDLTAKSLDLLHLVLPNAKKVAVLTSNNPTHPPLFETAKRGAATIGLTADRFVAATPADLEAAFAAMKSSNCDALYVLADPYRPTIPQLALTFGLPAIYQVDLYVEEGGLMSYGPDALGLFARAAYYVDRIIKGGNAADIPVEQPTTFRFIVNLRTAKALGVTIPETELLQADRIIE
jgi:putative ABC transport system substrate-binding protein